MGALFAMFRNLTKPNTALEAANGARVVLDSPEQALQVANQALNALPEQTMTVAPTQVAGVVDNGESAPSLQFSGGQPMFQDPDASNLPKIVKPTYMEASTDEAGNVKQSKALTKGGVLLNILRGGLQGGMDAMAGGALDAPRNGESSFGKGLRAAQEMPLIRQQRQMQQQAQQQQIASQQQEAQARAAMLPWLQRKTQADTLASEAEAKMRSAQAEAYQALAGQREITPEQKYAALDQIAQKYGIQKGTPEYNKFVLGIDPAKQDMSVSPFEAWRAQNPNAPVSEYYKMTNTYRHTGNAGGADGAAGGDVDAAARALIDPRNLTALKDVTSWRGDQRMKVFNRAKQLDPSFDPGLTNQRIKFLSSYEDPKGRAAINRQSINNILQHAGDLLDLNNQYRVRREFKPINTPINKIADMFGSTAYTQFALVNGVLKDELALYFAGGYAPNDDQIDMWNKIQRNEATPAQTEAFAREVARLAFRRANTFNSQFKSMMGYDDPNMLIPEAVGAADKLGLKTEAGKFGSGGFIGGGGSRSSGNGGTQAGYVRFKDSQGGLHDIPAGNLEKARQRDPGLQVISQ